MAVPAGSMRILAGAGGFVNGGVHSQVITGCLISAGNTANIPHEDAILVQKHAMQLIACARDICKPKACMRGRIDGHRLQDAKVITLLVPYNACYDGDALVYMHPN